MYLIEVHMYLKELCPSLRYRLCKNERITILGISQESYVMQVSTFEELLSWVRDRLEQVEENMTNNPQSDSTKVQSVSDALSSIKDLISNQDADLEDEYIKAAEDEYAALVELLQNRHIPITNDLRGLAEDIYGSQP